jgi:hypothetical protein
MEKPTFMQKPRLSTTMGGAQAQPPAHLAKAVVNRASQVRPPCYDGSLVFPNLPARNHPSFTIKARVELSFNTHHHLEPLPHYHLLVSFSI